MCYYRGLGEDSACMVYQHLSVYAECLASLAAKVETMSCRLTPKVWTLDVLTMMLRMNCLEGKDCRCMDLAHAGKHYHYDY